MSTQHHTRTEHVSLTERMPSTLFGNPNNAELKGLCAVHRPNVTHVRRSSNITNKYNPRSRVCLWIQSLWPIIMERVIW